MTEEMVTDVCVVGGGPGGVMLGLLLARAGIDVVVLEKHVDFFRDFRGDTVHPSTLNLIDQLGIREAFERIPHTRVSTLDVVINGVRLRGVDLRSLPKPNRADRADAAVGPAQPAGRGRPSASVVPAC